MSGAVVLAEQTDGTFRVVSGKARLEGVRLPNETRTVAVLAVLLDIGAATPPLTDEEIIDVLEAGGT